jgi:hypothetical protein
LSSEEVATLARRGALQLGLLVRACQQPDCADDPPFVGGDPLAVGGTFHDRDGTLEVSLADLPATQYFQYRVQLDRGTQSQSPALDLVRVTGRG